MAENVGRVNHRVYTLNLTTLVLNLQKNMLTLAFFFNFLHFYTMTDLKKNLEHFFVNNEGICSA